VFDLIIKNGTVIDPAQNLWCQLDVAITQGNLAALDAGLWDARQIIDATGLIVTPGLIDLHAHVADGIIPLGVAPDEAGVRSGVTTVVDAGSTGYTTFAGFAQYVIPNALTDLFAFLHLSPVGEAALPEIGWERVSAEKMIATIAQHRDMIKGIKLRITANLIHALGLDALKIAKQVSTQTGLLVMAHLGIDTGETLDAETLRAFTRDALAWLERGDILTHVFTKKPGGLFTAQGEVLPGVREAIARGVILDVASALGHLDFNIARWAIANGFAPFTLSTDFTTNLLNAPVPLTLPVLMSEFIALGASVSQVVAMTTINPAQVLGEAARRGSLRVGAPADVALFELRGGDWNFVYHPDGPVLKAKQLFLPRLTIKRGMVIEPSPRAKNYAQWHASAQSLFAGKATIEL